MASVLVLAPAPAEAQAGITVDPASVTVAEAGGQATFIMQLATQPRGNVTVTLDSGDTAIATVDPETLTFDALNFPRAFTVTGVNDNEVNPGNQRVTTIGLRASGSDYNDVTATISVKVTDDDSPEAKGDRAALVALYNATDGDNWANKNNWKSDLHVGQWFGVTTNSNGRVTSLILSTGFQGNRLTGQLPPQLGNLSELEILRLPNNQLTGPIPKELSNLSNLNTLDLSANQLTGPIPPELGELGNTLTALILSGNSDLTGCVPYPLRVAASVDAGQDPPIICPPRATLELTPASITENGGIATVTATLDGAPTANVTLTVSATPVAPAVADDFTLSGSTLTIATGKTTSTGNVTITAVDNGTPNSDRTVTVSAVASGSVMVTAPQDVVLTITDDEGGGRRDAELILAGTARTMASDAVDVMTGRFDASSTDGGSQMTLAGHALRLYPQGAQEADTDPWHRTPIHGDAAWWDDRQQTATALSAHDLLTRSSFDLALGEGGEGASGLTLWGRGSISGFAGSPDAGLNMKGSFGSGWLGLDYRVQPSVLVGLAITHASGAVDHGRTGRLDTDTSMTLTSVLPYAHLQVAPGLELWGMFGAGHGNMGVSAGGNDILATEIVSFMRAMGGRQALINLAGIDLAARADAFSATLHTEATADLPEASGSAQRVRLLVEGSRESGQVVSRFTLGGRWDGGTADTGVGLEVGGGLAWTQAATGLHVELQGRYLLTHSADGFEDWGASVDLRFDPGADERGLMFSLSPTLGDAASGTERLYGDADLSGLAANDNRTGRLEAELAYGVAGFGGAGRVMPYGGLALDGTDAARYRIGGRLALDSSLDLAVEGNRIEQDGASASHGISTQLGLRW